MKVAELLERRRRNWQQLESMCGRMRFGRLSMTPQEVARFAALYRAACADLALADAYQLPPSTVQYLHGLVGRAHNRLYRTRSFDFARWGRLLLVDVPYRVVRDRCIQFVFCLFWGVFILSAVLAYLESVWPEYAEQMLGHSMIAQLEENFSRPLDGRNWEENVMAASMYIRHNTGIGLQCFSGGLLIVPGLFITIFNSAYLGAAFGYMARPDVAARPNFFEFVTAHGPFELTAIALSAGAGLRLGVSWLATGGLTRGSALRKGGAEAMPMAGAAMVLFFLAAMIEGFLSPSPAPFAVKIAVAVASTMLLVLYFGVLGILGPGRAT